MILLYLLAVIKTTFKPANNVRDLNKPFQDKLPLATPGDYEIPAALPTLSRRKKNTSGIRKMKMCTIRL